MFVLAFALWTVLVRTVDVMPIGSNQTNVGFASLNKNFFELTHVHMTLYIVTDWLGLVPLLVCMGFGVMGIIQSIKRKSLLKVDCDLILLGVYYVLVILCYLFFEAVPVNYRPIFINGVAEASYPSSTTLLVLSVMPTLVFEIKRRVKNRKTVKVIEVLTVIFSVFTVTGRLICGVHWFTDIFGGVLLSAGLFLIYKSSVLLADEIRK